MLFRSPCFGYLRTGIALQAWPPWPCPVPGDPVDLGEAGGGALRPPAEPVLGRVGQHAAVPAGEQRRKLRGRELAFVCRPWQDILAMRKNTRMTLEHVEQTIIDAVRAHFADSVTSTLVDEGTNPIRDLGLDSHDGIEFAITLSAALGWEIPPDVNPFVDDKARCALTVGAAAERLFDLMATQEEVSK